MQETSTYRTRKNAALKPFTAAADASTAGSTRTHHAAACWQSHARIHFCEV
ncbi:hypothetical protein NPIL_93451, partial [Nephila pilipes]